MCMASSALEQLQLDPGRVNLSEEWRPYLLLDQGQPMGAPINCYTKLRVRIALDRNIFAVVVVVLQPVGGIARSDDGKNSMGKRRWQWLHWRPAVGGEVAMFVLWYRGRSALV